MDETKRALDDELLKDLATQPALAAYVEINHLKQLYRQGWLQAGIPREQCESVAEHCFGMALLAWLLTQTGHGLAERGAEHSVDNDRVLRMILAHELGEVYAGDVIPAEGVSREEKQRRERESLERICARLPNGGEFVALWEEFELGESAEARLVRQLDRLEMALQALIYERAGLASEERMDGFYASAGAALGGGEFEEILETIVGYRK